MKRLLTSSVLLIAALAVLASAPRVQAQDKTTEVPLTAANQAFQPAEVKVKAGQPFVLVVTNNDPKKSIEVENKDLRIEKVSYKSWQRCFGRSVGLRAPGRFVDAVKCVVARTRTAQLHEISPFQTRLSQYCHACGNYTRKPLWQRFHCCPHCGLGSEALIQRDLYSAWLASLLDPIRLTFPSRGQLGIHWQSMEACLSAALEATREHASAQGFLRRFGIPGVGACRPECFADPQQEPVASSEESEALLVAQEPL